MAKRLTRQLVQARGKCFDHRQCEKLNVVGWELSDISLCLQMPRLQVLSLSVNNIESLSDLRNCTGLRELYLRNNLISDFKELRELKDAKQLIHLGLEGNPCATAAGSEYRASVLRLLPQLQVIDNIKVSKSELEAALTYQPFVLEKPAEELPVLNPKRAAALERRKAHEREVEIARKNVRKRDHLLLCDLGLPSESSIGALPPVQSLPTSHQRAVSGERKLYDVMAATNDATNHLARVPKLPPLALPQMPRIAAGQNNTHFPPYKMTVDASTSTTALDPVAALEHQIPTGSNLLAVTMRLVQKMDNNSLMALRYAVQDIATERCLFD